MELLDDIKNLKTEVGRNLFVRINKAITEVKNRNAFCKAQTILVLVPKYAESYICFYVSTMLGVQVEKIGGFLWRDCVFNYGYEDNTIVVFQEDEPTYRNEPIKITIEEKQCQQH